MLSFFDIVTCCLLTMSSGSSESTLDNSSSICSEPFAHKSTNSWRACSSGTGVLLVNSAATDNTNAARMLMLSTIALSNFLRRNVGFILCTACARCTARAMLSAEVLRRPAQFFLEPVENVWSGYSLLFAKLSSLQQQFSQPCS